MEIRKLTDTGYVDAVAISRDGRYVIYARKIGENVSLRMRQIESGGDIEVLPPAKVYFVGLTFSPDGNYLYFVRSDKSDTGSWNLYVMPALGGPSRELMSGVDSQVSFSPDGRQFVFTRGFQTKNQTEVRIANTDGSGDHLVTTIQESIAGYGPGATWSPDGRTIAVPIYHLGSKFTIIEIIGPGAPEPFQKVWVIEQQSTVEEHLSRKAPYGLMAYFLFVYPQSAIIYVKRCARLQGPTN